MMQRGSSHVSAAAAALMYYKANPRALLFPIIVVYPRVQSISLVMMNSVLFVMHLLFLLLTSTTYTMGLSEKLDCRLVDDDQVNCINFDACYNHHKIYSVSQKSTP